jgi:hypothetical protein
MMRFKVPVAFFTVAVVTLMSLGSNQSLSAADTNAYFDALITRAGFWKGYSLRPKPGFAADSPYFSNQLEYKKDGGYQQSSSAPRFITYDSAMDAAKVVIPAWIQPLWSTVIGSAMGTTDTKFYPSPYSSGQYPNGRQVRIDGEVMIITGVDADTVSPRGVTVSRAQYGTKAAAHTAGAALYLANNSLPHQVRLPLDTVDGNTYAFTWDVFYSSSFMNTGLEGNKTFQFSSGEDTIWWEVKTRMDGGSKVSIPPSFDPSIHVGGMDVRSYNKPGGNANWSLTDGKFLGPGVLSAEPVTPMQTTWLLYPNRWIRYWVVVDQRANDYDYIDLYAADEQTGPVQIFKHIAVSTFTNRAGVPTINKFWLEFNDSMDRLPAERASTQRDMVAYVRNFAAFRNIGDVTPLLQRPVAGVLPGNTVELPGAPKNVRIVRY